MRMRAQNRIIQREHLILLRLDHEEVLQLFQLVGMLRGEIVVLRIVIGDVVELPFVASQQIGHFGRAHEPRGLRRDRGGDPAIVVDRAVAEHLEVLRVALRLRFRVRLVKRVGHAHAFDRLLLDTVRPSPAPGCRRLQGSSGRYR